MLSPQRRYLEGSLFDLAASSVSLDRLRVYLLFGWQSCQLLFGSHRFVTQVLGFIMKTEVYGR